MDSDMEESTEFGGSFWVSETNSAYVSKPNPVLEKSFAFAVRILNFHKWLSKHHPDISPLAKQILRSGTSIGANLEEADSAYSKREFAVKVGLSLKESRETKYWLRLLYATDYIDSEMFSSLCSDNDELMRLLNAILKTTRENLK
ncbi:four helix bundle protein [Spirosoma sordidisoli]|uniref:Four helix bundle protein n=2 Tax=Spirosoma sordidisoli TaxID=2502893 RepID=A0A4Q2UKJ0_9BACT|nr:four helix bundle protein [Spirosoma sordidisoli]